MSLFDDIFDAHQRELAQQKTEKDRQRAEHDEAERQFLLRFNQFIDEVVRPLFVEVANDAKKRDRHASVEIDATGAHRAIVLRYANQSLSTITSPRQSCTLTVSASLTTHEVVFKGAAVDMSMSPIQRSFKSTQLNSSAAEAVTKDFLAAAMNHRSK